MSQRNPYSSQELDGPMIDIDWALEQEGFRVRRIKKTGNRRLMLEVMCAPEGPARAEVQPALERAWLEQAAFDREAHLLTQEEYEVRLEFVTWWEHTGGKYDTGATIGNYVTGRIVVDLRALR